MTGTAAEFLRAAAQGLRADVEHIAQGRLSKDLPESERIRMEAKKIAASYVEQVAEERLASVRDEFAAQVNAIATSNWNRGRAVGLGDAGRILEVKVQVARWWWQVPPLRAALAAVNRLADHYRDAAGRIDQ